MGSDPQGRGLQQQVDEEVTAAGSTASGAKRPSALRDLQDRITGVRAFLYDADVHDQEVELTRSTLSSLTDRQLLWVDVLSHDREETATLCQALALPPLICELAFAERGTPGLSKCEGFMHATLVALHFNSS